MTKKEFTREHLGKQVSNVSLSGDRRYSTKASCVDIEARKEGGCWIKVDKLGPKNMSGSAKRLVGGVKEN